MSDEDDYMSDKFLQGSEKCTAPSLLYRHADKRQFTLMKKKAEVESRMKDSRKSIQIVEQEKREEGLSSAITNTNKGFEMLMKMGYKPGQGIGKSESGIAEPIGVEVKTDRQGLGKPVQRKTARSKKTEDKLDGSKVASFRDRIASQRLERLLKTDLYKSQKVCKQLDMQLLIEDPKETWFWTTDDAPSKDDDDTDPEEEEVDKDDILSTEEKIQILTKYLRDKHFYCIWCGVAYDDQDDLRDNCPGNTRNDH
ncbi:hypothetical protein KM043_007231 [Ampulex compressa]|nr:hypothetical protein KM043_007231 [Ampulex compressa]